MKKLNSIDVAFKDKTKFDTQNSIIGTLLTQIESGKTKNEKLIENQLKGGQLRESNRKNNNGHDDNDDDSPPLPSVLSRYYPPSLSIDDEDSDLEND